MLALHDIIDRRRGALKLTRNLILIHTCVRHLPNFTDVSISKLRTRVGHANCRSSLSLTVFYIVLMTSLKQVTIPPHTKTIVTVVKDQPTIWN